MPVTPLLALMLEKVSWPLLLWFALVYVRSDCTLTFQIFYDASSEYLRPCQILLHTDCVDRGKHCSW